MKRWAFFLSAIALIPAFSGAEDHGPDGVYRPSLSTNPRGYLRDFPLGKVPVDEIIQLVGTPDKTYSLAGKDYITFDIEPKRGSGKIEYTYIAKDGVVIDVTYLNAGNFFGVTQRESANSLQAKE